MAKRNLLFLLIISFPFFLISQDQNFLLEEHDKVFEVVIPNPNISQHYPGGLIYRDSAYNYMSNITNGYITLANGPYGFQFSPDPFDYIQLSHNSLKFYDNTFTSNSSWRARSLGSSYYDLETHGDIQSVANDGRTFAELTSGIGEGFLKLYRYELFGTITATYSVDGRTVVSDRRLKHDIAPMKRLLPKVLRLRPSTYVYNGFEKSSLGFIAQEVLEIFPELISEIDGNLAVNYSAFSTIAIQAIKEQQETISFLTTQVQALESRLTALEKIE